VGLEPTSSTLLLFLKVVQRLALAAIACMVGIHNHHKQKEKKSVQTAYVSRCDQLSQRQITNLLLYNLDDILVLKAMAEPTMLWIVPRTGSPYKHIFHILEQASVDMIAEVFNCAATSILMAQKRTLDRLFPSVRWNSNR